MQLNSYFNEFLAAIRPTSSQRKDLKTGHKVLRDRLRADADLADLYVADFLQGSYRRATAIRPQGERHSDVDVILVTNLNRAACTPEDALQRFIPFMERHYKGKYHLQGRSIGVVLTYVELDLVITSAPSEGDKRILTSASVMTDATLEEARDWRLSKSWVPAEERHGHGLSSFTEKAAAGSEWKASPLYIPDRERKCWQRTHPLEQIRWTRDKNDRCNGHYVNVVKALKWWRRELKPEPKHPKGYPVEHLVGVSCPDGIESVAEGVTKTLEAIVKNYSAHAAVKAVPDLRDHGVPEHNVFARVSGEDFAAFYANVEEAASLARRALDEEDLGRSARLWRELFGTRFPEPPEGGDDEGGGGGPPTGGFTPRSSVSSVTGGRFA